MTDAPIETLELLRERAALERDRLTGELRHAEEVALRMRRQGEQLVAYRAEYVQRWSSQFARGGAIEIVHCYQSFMQRLDEALEQQQAKIEAAGRQAEAQRQALVQAELRVASVRKLIERRRAEFQRESQRREQRVADETAQQLAQRRPRATLALQH